MEKGDFLKKTRRMFPKIKTEEAPGSFAGFKG
jgi:hypothetical protein